MNELRELYQEVILDHSKKPRNFHSVAKPSHHAEGYNPLCGDRITLYLQVEDGVIKDIGFEGSGCAISKASASMMTVSLKGKKGADAQALFREFHKMLAGSRDQTFDKERLGKLAVFSGVSEFPVRVKCATLPWHTFRAALEGAKQSVSTEAFSTEWTTG